MKFNLQPLTLFALLNAVPLWGQGQTPRSTLPTLMLETDNGLDVQSKENYEHGNLTIVHQGQTQPLYEGGIRIRGRGNSTWRLDKKPYRINLDQAGSLLGMPATARNWVLLANHADKTLIRNAIGLEMSRFVGMPYASPFRFVDVFLNNRFRGAYLLTDHMEVRANRVDIEEGQPESEPGAYLVEVDGFGEEEPIHFKTNQDLVVTIKYPDLESRSGEQYDYIRNHINEFEARLFSGIPADAPGGYLEKVDLQSLVNWYIVCELTGNPDSFWSVYLHKRRSDDRFFFGPHWDFDIAFDNDYRFSQIRYRLMADVAQNYIFRRWIVRLRQDDVFMRAVKQRWNQLKNMGFRNYIFSELEEYENVLHSSGSREANFNEWNVLHYRVYLEVFDNGSYDDHVQFLSNFLTTRFDWLDRELNGFPSHFNYKIVNIRSDLALTANGSNVVQNTYQEQAAYLWRIVPVTNGYFMLVHVGSNTALTRGENSNEATVLSATDPDNPRQQWRITESLPGKFAIINRDGIQGLQNRNNSTEHNAAIHTINIFSYDPEGRESNYWLDRDVDGRWLIEPVGGALPVTLAEFTGRYQENSILLNWEISESDNSSHFEVERLTKGGAAQTLTAVKSTGTGNYQWADSHPLPGVNYYRLKAVDLDGSFSYSSVIAVLNQRLPLKAGIFPNPVSETALVELEAVDSGAVNIKVVNAMGMAVMRSLHEARAGKNEIPLRLERIPAGVYFLEIRQNGQISTLRFVKSQ